MGNIILLMPHYQVALFKIWAVSELLLRLNSRLIAEVILFIPEVTNDLSHVCIQVVEENIGDAPLGCISMDPDVEICHVLPDLWPLMVIIG